MAHGKQNVVVAFLGATAAFAIQACASSNARDAREEVTSAEIHSAHVTRSTAVTGAGSEPFAPNREAIEPPRPLYAPCPASMTLIEGESCPDVEQTCLEWLDPPSSRYAHFRCKRYATHATCKVSTVYRRYCIDTTERTEPDSQLPRHEMSWTSSRALCEADTARLCRESEWVFACEGVEMRPYPYGWERDSTACHTDLTEGIGRVGHLRDLRAPVGSHVRCASPFGVQDMAGNVEEWAQADGPGTGSKMGWKEVLKGSWWIPSRHACRQFQVGHNDSYKGAETGTRCCKDAEARASDP